MFLLVAINDALTFGKRDDMHCPALAKAKNITVIGLHRKLRSWQV